MNLETFNYYAVYERAGQLFCHACYSMAHAGVVCHDLRPRAMPYYGTRAEVEWLVRPENRDATLMLCERWDLLLRRIYSSDVSRRTKVFMLIAPIVRKGTMTHE